MSKLLSKFFLCSFFFYDVSTYIDRVTKWGYFWQIVTACLFLACVQVKHVECRGEIRIAAMYGILTHDCSLKLSADGNENWSFEFRSLHNRSWCSFLIWNLMIGNINEMHKSSFTFCFSSSSIYATVWTAWSAFVLNNLFHSEKKRILFYLWKLQIVLLDFLENDILVFFILRKLGQNKYSESTKTCFNFMNKSNCTTLLSN